jgi:hypothetical protein
MKKTWIKIKRGLLEPKHRDKLGIRVWLYLYILDQADWDTGKVLEWRDADTADELDMPPRTIRQQRQQLDDDGYITCEQGYRKQVITIHNYSNPRKYDDEILNHHGDINLSPLPDGDINGDIHGDINGVSKLVTPSLYSQITNHNDIKNMGGAGFYIFNLVGFNYDDADNKIKAAISQLVNKYSEYKVCAMADRYVQENSNIGLRPLLAKIEENAPFYEMPAEAKVEGYY